MKIIEAMKQVKELARKQDDLRGKVAQNCAHLNFETPVYADPTATVRGWLQSYEDISQEIVRLRVAVQRTNLATQVPISLGGTTVTKSIAEWILRRGGKDKDGQARSDYAAWSQVNDRGLKEGGLQSSVGQAIGMEVKVVRNFDPAERDRKVDLFRGEPSAIDAALEVVNATTDLIES